MSVCDIVATEVADTKEGIERIPLHERILHSLAIVKMGTDAITPYDKTNLYEQASVYENKVVENPDATYTTIQGKIPELDGAIREDVLIYGFCYHIRKLVDLYQEPKYEEDRDVIVGELRHAADGMFSVVSRLYDIVGNNIETERIADITFRNAETVRLMAHGLDG